MSYSIVKKMVHRLNPDGLTRYVAIALIVDENTLEEQYCKSEQIITGDSDTVIDDAKARTVTAFVAENLRVNPI